MEKNPIVEIQKLLNTMPDCVQAVIINKRDTPSINSKFHFINLFMLC